MREKAVFLLSLFLTMSGGVAADFAELSARAAAALAAEKLPEALQLYRQALQLKPDWAEGWWFAGIISYDSGQFADGRQAFSRLIALNQNSAPGLAFLGLCEFETGAYDAALDHIERGLELSGGGPPAAREVLRYHQALLLTRQRKWDQARLLYREFVQRGVQNPELLAGIGINALERPLLPTEVRQDQQVVMMMAGTAVWFWMSGDEGKSASAFRDLLARYPSTPGVHYLYATYLLSLDRQEPGMAELKRELALDPANPSAESAMALALLQADKPSEALALAKAAAASPSPGARILYSYGLALSKTGSLPEAARQLEAAERLDPRNLGVHIALAGLYSQTGRNDQARQERITSMALAKGNETH